MRDVMFNKRVFYNPAKLDAAYTIELAEVINTLDFELSIIKNPPCDTNSEDNKVIESIKNV